MHTSATFAFILIITITQSRSIDNDTLIRQCADGYTSNVESFQWFKCRFKRTTYSDLKDGGKTKAVVYDGLWVKRFERQRYQLDCDPRIIQTLKTAMSKLSKTSAGQGRIDIPCRPSVRALIDTGKNLQHFPLIEGATIHARWSHSTPFVNEMNPFTMGIMARDGTFTPGRMLEFCQEGILTCQKAELVTIDGHHIARFSLMNAKQKEDIDITLDICHGYLPKQIEAKIDGVTKYRFTQTQAQHTVGGGWFPTELEVVYAPDSERASHDKLVVTDFNNDQQPSDNDLSLTLPAGTQINTPDAVGGTFSLTAPMKISVEDIEKLYNQCVDKERAHEGTFVNQAQQGKPTFVLPWLLIGVVLIALCLWSYNSRRVRSARANKE